MSTFGIDGIRIDFAGHITHVRWAPIDPKTREWLSPTKIVEVGELVKAIQAGEVCWSLFTLGGKRFLFLSKFEWVRCRVKCGRKPGEANT